jgi:hypothetical protein
MRAPSASAMPAHMTDLRPRQVSHDLDPGCIRPRSKIKNTRQGTVLCVRSCTTSITCKKKQGKSNNNSLGHHASCIAFTRAWHMRITLIYYSKVTDCQAATSKFQSQYIYAFRSCQARTQQPTENVHTMPSMYTTAVILPAADPTPRDCIWTSFVAVEITKPLPTCHTSSLAAVLHRCFYFRSICTGYPASVQPRLRCDQ